MKKIGFFIMNIESAGGTERVSINVANALAKQGYDVSFISIGGNKPFFQVDEKINIYAMNKLPYSLKKDYFSITKKLRELVKELQLDTLIVVDGVIMLFSALALVNLHVKHILWEHYSFNFTGNRLVRTLGKYLASTRCDKVVTLTESEKMLWQEKFKTNNIISIANPNTLLPKNKLAKWENKTILSVGHLFSYKGFDYLLKAWHVLAKNHPDWNLKIVGSGEEEENLKNLAKALDIEDSVNFIPRTNDVAFYYESSSIYCLPSQTEGLPLVAIEAMAFGLPIVAFNCSPGVKQLVEHKENGFLCEKNNIEEMVNGLDLLMNNSELYQQMSEKSRVMSEDYGIEKIIEEWKAIL